MFAVAWRAILLYKRDIWRPVWWSFCPPFANREYTGQESALRATYFCLNCTYLLSSHPSSTSGESKFELWSSVLFYSSTQTRSSCKHTYPRPWRAHGTLAEILFEADKSVVVCVACKCSQCFKVQKIDCYLRWENCFKNGLDLKLWFCRFFKQNSQNFTSVSFSMRTGVHIVEPLAARQMVRQK